MSAEAPVANIATAHMRSTAKLAWAWTWYELRMWMREPAAVLLNMAYPLIMLAFFFVAPTGIRSDPIEALSLLGYLSLVGVLMVCLNFPANGIPETRESDFYRFSRSLPIGAWPRLIAWIAAPLLCGLVSALAAFGIGTLVSAAEPTWIDFLSIMLVALGLSVPMTLIGLTLGFLLTRKTALAVSLTVAFALILFGGISGFPLPPWIGIISQLLPSGASGTLIANYLGGDSPSAWNILTLVGWTIAGLIGAVALYRRDESRKFR